MMRNQDQQSRVFYELCTLIFSILQSPLSLPIPVSNPQVMASSSQTTTKMMNQVSPAAFASLFIGISLALMVCGSLTFVIGFILMPWVLGLVMVFYLVGIVSNLSVLGRTILCPPQRKKMSSCNFLSS